MKSAAAFAIGSMSVGNLAKYLPLIINEIKQQPKRQYLLLSALKEVLLSSVGGHNTVFLYRLSNKSPTATRASNWSRLQTRSGKRENENERKRYLISK